MRLRHLLVATCCVVVQLAAPAPAQAWWEWLDQLSGPGPFMGWDLQYRVICIEDTQGGADVRLSNIQSKFWKEVARFAGVGCAFDEDKNPLASFNFAVGRLYSRTNKIQADKDRDRVRMSKLEPSFSIFVDRLKVVELTSGLGMMLVTGQAFDRFERFYWKPIQVTVTPGAAKGLRGPILRIGVLIIPKGFDAADFRATGTFHTDQDVLTTASISWDFSRRGR